MESISTKKLLPIFKLSLLSKILPYFGYLHDWKWILESINKKTNDIWEENKEVLKYWGRHLKLSLHLEDRHIKLSENILLKAELFKFQTDRFFNIRWKEKTQDKIKELKIDSLILQLCNQLNEDNAIVFQKWGDKIDEIFLQTRKEIAEMIPSSKCTSSILEIKKFENNQAKYLWKYIADCIKLKWIILKKNENNTFEVDSITSHHFLDRDKYNILNKEVRERLATYYSCPVSNCICKPKTLWLSLWNRYPYEISKELIDEIWELSLLENAHQLTIEGNVKSLSQISYLSRIQQQFPKLEILFNFSSKRRYGIEWDENYMIHINSWLITLVTEGEERIFHISKDYQSYVDEIIDLEFNEKGNIAIINWGHILLENVILQVNSKSESKDQTLIDKLKEKTRLEDSQYIIVDTNTSELEINALKIEKYTSIAKYFKFIYIRIDETESEYKKKIEEINKLPKQWKIEFWTENIQDFVNSDALSLINQDFDQIIVESNRLKIKLIKSNSRSRERMFTFFEPLCYKDKTADIDKIREMISKLYE